MPLFAQFPKSQFNRTIDCINAILKANPLAYYTDNSRNSTFIKKISANEKGIVTFTDSIPKSVINKKEPLPACCPPKKNENAELVHNKKK